MTKEQVLALCANEDEKARVEAAYTAAERFKKEPVFTAMTTEIQVKGEVKTLVDNYTKRMLAKEKKAKADKEAMEAQSSKIQKFESYLKQAKEAGLTEDDFFKAIEGMLKERYNKAIEAQIAELKAKMIK